MKLVIEVGSPAVRVALEAAEAVGVHQLTSQLHAPVDAALLGRVDEAWQQVREAVLLAFRKGTQEAQSVADQVQAKLDELLKAAGTKARLVEDALRERMRTLQASLNRTLLEQVVGSVSAGGEILTLSSVQMTQAIRVQGSLKSSITELIQLASEGSLEIVAVYDRLGPDKGWRQEANQRPRE